MSSFTGPKAEMIKRNARPLPRIFAKFSKKKIKSKVLEEGIHEKEISEEELETVKRKIREKTANENRRKTRLRLLIIAVLLIPTFFIGHSFYKSIEEGKLLTAKELERSYEHRQELIVEGYKLLKTNQFFKAKIKFLSAAKIDPDDYPLQLGLTTCYVKLCRYARYDCDRGEKALDRLKAEYGNLPEINNLNTEFIKIRKPRNK